MIKRILFLLTCLASSLSAQEVTGGEVALELQAKQTVKAAVQSLGNEVLKSNFSYAVEHMYPRWRERQAKRLGSEQKMLEAFNNAGAQMQEMGITIDSFEALEPQKAYHVHPKMKDGVKQITTSADLHYEVLVFVPTRMKMSFMLEGQPKRSFMRESFQVAVAREGSEQWTFIDGATIRVVDLRSLFPLLPKNLELPEKRDIEVK
ncbi:hypothetical protein ACFPK9_02555 [Rubritalea spongiae]|uniref:DUF3887 domain-containing protein n=1 Tax=Rubritalea spongiae TaxID=430797 RepID=A0ABW5E1N1_9BACT